MNFDLLLALILLAPLRGGARTVALAATPLSLAGYIADLRQWQSAVDQIKTHPGDAGRLEAKAPPAWSIEFQGQRYETPADWLRKDLGTIKSNPRLAARETDQIERRLAALEEAAEAASAAARIDPHAARAALSVILSQREFRSIYSEALRDTLIDRVFNWVGGIWDKLFSGLATHPRARNVIAWGLLSALAIVLIVWLARLFMRDRERLALRLEAPLAGKHWREWMREAAVAAERGDYRGAVHAAYWAGVLRLGELRAWEVRRDRTPREYLRMLPSTDTRQTPWRAVTRRFERSWYGGENPSREDFARVVSDLEKLGCATC